MNDGDPGKKLLIPNFWWVAAYLSERTKYASAILVVLLLIFYGIGGVPKNLILRQQTLLFSINVEPYKHIKMKIFI